MYADGDPLPSLLTALQSEAGRPVSAALRMWVARRLFHPGERVLVALHADRCVVGNSLPLKTDRRVLELRRGEARYWRIAREGTGAQVLGTSFTCHVLLMDKVGITVQGARELTIGVMVAKLLKASSTK